MKERAKENSCIRFLALIVYLFYLFMPLPNWGHLKNIFVTSEKSNIFVFPQGRSLPDCIRIVFLRVKVGVKRGQLDIRLINRDPLDLISPSVCGLKKNDHLLSPKLNYMYVKCETLKWQLTWREICAIIAAMSGECRGVSGDVWGEAEYFLVQAPGTNQISHWPRTIPISDPE